jgi:hypothetical protein
MTEEGTMTEIAKVMASTTVEGTMTEIAGAMTGKIDMMTAEATTIIVKAMTRFPNRSLPAESYRFLAIPTRRNHLL